MSRRLMRITETESGGVAICLEVKSLDDIVDWVVQRQCQCRCCMVGTCAGLYKRQTCLCYVKLSVEQLTIARKDVVFGTVQIDRRVQA